MKKIDELTVNYLSILLANNDFFGASLILDDFLKAIDKNNYDDKLNLVKRSIELGREGRIIDFETNGGKEEFSTSDKEAILIVNFAKKLYRKLEVDNYYLNAQDEIYDMNHALNTFVKGLVVGDWFFSDDCSWKEKKVNEKIK